MSSIKEMHDELLAKQPDSAEHDPKDCALCNENISKETNNTTEGGDMKTYTEEEFTTAVKEAVAPLQAAADAKVAELQAKLEEFTASKATEEVAGQIAEVKIELDNAELRATKAEEKYTELVAYFESMEAAKAEEAKRETRKAEIRELAKEAGFKDDRIEVSLDRWADMSEEVFAAVLEDWKLIATTENKSEAKEEELSTAAAETAMSTVRNETKPVSAARAVFAARGQGIDVRKI